MAIVKLPSPKVRKFAGGGAAEAQPAQQPGQEQGGGQGQDPTQQLAQMVQEYMQSHDPQLADQIIGMVAQMLGLQGGGDQGQQQPPADQGQGQQPMGRNGMKVEAPVFKKGGKFTFKSTAKSKDPSKVVKKTGKSAFDSYQESKKKVDSTSALDQEEGSAMKMVAPSSVKKAPVNVHLEFNPESKQIEPVNLHISIGTPVGDGEEELEGKDDDNEDYEMTDEKGKPHVKKKGFIIGHDRLADMVSGLNTGKYKMKK